MLNRRGFFAALAGAAAVFSLDPERALWVPGNKVISVPKILRLPKWRHFGYSYQICPTSDTPTPSEIRYQNALIDQSVREIEERIRKDVRAIDGREPTFAALELPHSVESAWRGPLRSLRQARIVKAYDFSADNGNGAMFLRVDCAVKI